MECGEVECNAILSMSGCKESEVENDSEKVRQKSFRHSCPSPSIQSLLHSLLILLFSSLLSSSSSLRSFYPSLLFPPLILLFSLSSCPLFLMSTFLYPPFYPTPYCTPLCCPVLFTLLSILHSTVPLCAVLSSLPSFSRISLPSHFAFSTTIVFLFQIFYLIPLLTYYYSSSFHILIFPPSH